MNAFKRAFLYITRKRGKTLLLALIIFVISSLVLSGLAALDAEEKQSAELRGTTGAGFTIKSIEKWNNYQNDDKGGGSSIAETKPITPKMIDEIMGIDGLKSNSGSQLSVFGLYDSNGKNYINDYNNKTKVDRWSLNSFQGFFCTNTEYNSLFLSGKIALVEGRQIIESDKNTLIISKKLAEKLGLKVGDQVSALINPENNDPSVPYTIVGLFEVLADESDPKNQMGEMTMDDLYGTYSYYWFADTHSMNAVFQNYPDSRELLKDGFNQVDFFVTDPQRLEAIIQAVQNLPGINWDDYELSANDEVFERTAGSMSDISSLIRTLITVIVIVSMGIVTLILSMWVKSRIRETGILLAAGISKASILLQYILEVGWIGVVSFPLSYLFSRVIAGGIGSLFGKTGVEVTMEHLSLVCGWGALLLAAAVFISCISMMRLKPKEILTKMS